ncbi:hypothetical protein HDV02_000690 [Globomyces sp. JEL0801]|nr:hypothetical protein HDV02_000690 [Globomyces sp. JEL0801]
MVVQGSIFSQQELDNLVDALNKLCAQKGPSSAVAILLLIMTLVCFFGFALVGVIGGSMLEDGIFLVFIPFFGFAGFSFSFIIYYSSKMRGLTSHLNDFCTNESIKLRERQITIRVDDGLQSLMPLAFSRSRTINAFQYRIAVDFNANISLVTPNATAYLPMTQIGANIAGYGIPQIAQHYQPIGNNQMYVQPYGLHQNVEHEKDSDKLSKVDHTNSNMDSKGRTYPEFQIIQLMGLGLVREKAIATLSLTDGDMTKAVYIAHYEAQNNQPPMYFPSK